MEINKELLEAAKESASYLPDQILENKRLLESHINEFIDGANWQRRQYETGILKNQTECLEQCYNLMISQGSERSPLGMQIKLNIERAKNGL